MTWDALDYARFRRFLFFYCPRRRYLTRVFRCFSFSTAPRRLYSTRVFRCFSFSTATGACILRAFSLISLFLLPLHALDYARFPRFFFFYCPRCLYPTRVFHYFSFSTAPGDCILRAFSAILLSLLPRCLYPTRVFWKFSFHTARNLSIITLHSLISLSRLHAAFAGLVLGSLTAGIPICFSQYL